jgi:hypothetical protein
MIFQKKAGDYSTPLSAFLSSEIEPLNSEWYNPDAGWDQHSQFNEWMRVYNTSNGGDSHRAVSTPRITTLDSDNSFLEFNMNAHYGGTVTGGNVRIFRHTSTPGNDRLYVWYNGGWQSYNYSVTNTKLIQMYYKPVAQEIYVWVGGVLVVSETGVTTIGDNVQRQALIDSTSPTHFVYIGNVSYYVGLSDGQLEYNTGLVLP